VHSQNKSCKETPPNPSHENPNKRLQKSQKGKTPGDKETLDEPHRIFYTYNGRFIQGLASRPNIQPSLNMNHEALKQAYGKPMGRGKPRKQMNTRIHAPKGTLGILVVAPSDRCPTIASRLASMQALRSRRVSSTSKSLGASGSRLYPPRLRSWLCGSIKELDGFVVKCCKPHELSVASTPIPLMTWPPQSSLLGVGFVE
jgi:hypothetical protein